jgi:hypothetical protein
MMMTAALSIDLSSLLRWLDLSYLEKLVLHPKPLQRSFPEAETSSWAYTLGAWIIVYANGFQEADARSTRFALQVLVTILNRHAVQ